MNGTLIKSFMPNVKLLMGITVLYVRESFKELCNKILENIQDP